MLKKKETNQSAVAADGEAVEDDSPLGEPVAGEGQQARTFVGTGFYWPVVVGMLLAAAIVVLVFQNTDPVRMQWLWLEVDAPLVVVVLVTVIGTGLVTEVFGWSWRRRRRRALSDREELRHLKRL